jgi:3-oxoacyl-[acyl-carrier protein] reductase
MPDCVILSGGSRGLGLALAGFCLENGFRVATFARSETPEIHALAEKNPGRLIFRALDGTDAAGVRAFVGDAVDAFGPIHALVNNAAVGQDHLLVHLPEEQIGALLAVNLEAPILLTRTVLKQMLLAGVGGRIINITSICATRGFAGLSVYTAAKGGLEALTRSLAHEVGPRGILVNAIAPGFFSSEMSAVLAGRQIDTIRRRTATEKLITVEDVLPPFRLLLMDDCNLSGQVLHVDGGW